MDRDEVLGNIESIDVTDAQGPLSPLELMTIALGAIIVLTPHRGLRIKYEAIDQFTSGETTELRISQDAETGDMLVLLAEEDKNAIN